MPSSFVPGTERLELRRDVFDRCVNAVKDGVVDRTVNWRMDRPYALSSLSRRVFIKCKVRSYSEC